MSELEYLKIKYNTIREHFDNCKGNFNTNIIFLFSRFEKLNLAVSEYYKTHDGDEISNLFDKCISLANEFLDEILKIEIKYKEC